MSSYGQYCPIAQALDVIGDRWTLLIIRDMLTGTRHFNALQRGLPGLSRGLLAKRLRQLQAAGVIEKRVLTTGQKTTEYRLTAAGQALQEVINTLVIWGATWAFGDPSPEQLDPLLLLWWMHDRVHVDRLPQDRIVVQFHFLEARPDTYWLVLARQDVTICLTDPGYAIDVLVTTPLATGFKLWLGRISYTDALQHHGLQVDGIPRLTRAFPDWFVWSPAAPAIRALAPAPVPSAQAGDSSHRNPAFRPGVAPPKSLQ